MSRMLSPAGARNPSASECRDGTNAVRRSVSGFTTSRRDGLRKHWISAHTSGQKSRVGVIVVAGSKDDWEGNKTWVESATHDLGFIVGTS